MAGSVEPVPLLEGKREWIAFFLAAALLFGLHLAWRYREYRRFVDRPLAYVWGRVFWVAPVPDERGRIRAKVCAPEIGCFWTAWHTKSDDLEGRRVRLKIFLRRPPGFVRYLRGAYLPTRVLERSLEPPDLRSRLGRWIERQHSSSEMAALYRALFLADPLPDTLRQKLTAWGINHLAALSGFHLGILTGVLWAFLGPAYRRLQRRFFPWRHELRDVGMAVMLLLAAYLWLTGAPPSLLRAYVMALLGWIALLWGVEIKRYGFLAVVAGVLLVLFPELFFSWGFWLSMSGVYFIYLLLHRAGSVPSWLMGGAVIPAGLFLLMAPLVHTLFERVTPGQPLSILISLLFVPFYPLAMLSHLAGAGGVMDRGWMALWRWAEEMEVYRVSLPFWFLVGYGVMALAAARWRWAFWGVLFCSGGAILWLVVRAIGWV